MTTSFASLRTPLAGAYLVEIGRTWHRDEDALAENHIEIPFPIGRVAIDVNGDVLNVTLTANSHYESTLLEDLIADQIDRLSSDEDLHYQWLRTDELAATRGQRSTFHFFR